MVFERIQHCFRPCGAKRRHTEQEGKLRRRPPSETEEQGEKNRAARARGSGKCDGHELRQAEDDREFPRHLRDDRTPPQPELRGHKQHPADEQRERDGRDGVRQGQAHLFHRQRPGGGDRESEQQLEEVVAVLRLLPALQSRQPAGEKRQRGEHCAALDDRIENLGAEKRLVDVLSIDGEELLREEQVSGGRDGNELGDPFDQAEDDRDEPMGHGICAE